MTPPVTAQSTASRTMAEEDTPCSAPVSLKRILVALDASDYANRALTESIRLAKSADGVITGIHAYAAQLHDRRFKMMEGGLPERYQEESEMVYQREVHDDLITRGLNIITDSYHDAGQQLCDSDSVPFRRLSPEGKNYAKIIEAARTGAYDVLALGALGLGAVPDSLIGAVCERVVRRSPIDCFVVRDTGRAIGEGPIVVGLDGSAMSYGGLMTALDIAARTGAEVHAIAAYDPYYHYVAFNAIAGVLSDEAGKVFRFKEQEQLHEELIDDGIAKIYQSHLDVAGTIARDLKVPLVRKLLDGKPFTAIRKYLEEVNASLLVMGRRGVHADDELDIGGNAENMLRMAPCHVWLTVSEYEPPLDVVAEESVTWSVEAEQKLSRAPSFVQDMARRMVLRHAHQLGHTYITSDLVDEVMKGAMPNMGGGEAPVAKGTLVWTPAAEELLGTLEEGTITDNIRLRAVKKARREKAEKVGVRHVRPFMALAGTDAAQWSAAALARLARVPEMVRRTVKAEIEDMAADENLSEISLELADRGIVEVRKAMCPIEPGAESVDD